MSLEIRSMLPDDKSEVLKMMRVFYDSPAVAYEIADDILKKDIDDCIGCCPLLEGFIFQQDDKICGYAMTAMCYATEFGGVCIWLEDLYLKEEYRGQQIGSRFFDYLEKRYPDAVRFKLEVEQENEAGIALYKKKGYGISPYYVMTKEIK